MINSVGLKIIVYFMWAISALFGIACGFLTGSPVISVLVVVSGLLSSVFLMFCATVLDHLEKIRKFNRRIYPLLKDIAGDDTVDLDI